MSLKLMRLNGIILTQFSNRKSHEESSKCFDSVHHHKEQEIKLEPFQLTINTQLQLA